MSKLAKDVIGFPTPLEMGNANPLDSRFVVEKKSDLTNVGADTSWRIKGKYTNVYPGMQVYVTEKKATYMFTGGIGENLDDVKTLDKWRIISDGDTSSDKLLTNIHVNSKEGVVSNHIASVTIDGADVKLGDKYTEKTLTSPVVGETRETPVKTDTVNDSILKIVTILGKDEAVLGTTMSKLNTLSGKTVTEIESSGKTITCTKEIANDGTVKYNLETNSSNIDVSGLNLGLHYTPKQGGSAPTISLSSTKGETVDATDFIKDGMIQSVALDNTQKNIVITWNTDGGGSTTTIPLSNLANIYEFFAGDETHNVVFSTTDKTTDNTTIVKADVNMVDCGMYDDSVDPT